MATFLSLHNDIAYKIKQSALYVKELRFKNIQLAEENEKLTEEIIVLQMKLNALNEKYQLLNITRTILKKEDIVETKKYINDIVREINKCMDLLKND